MEEKRRLAHGDPLPRQLGVMAVRKAPVLGAPHPRHRGRHRLGVATTKTFLGQLWLLWPGHGTRLAVVLARG